MNRPTSGLALTELVVVAVLLSALTGLLYGTFRYFSQTSAWQSAQSVTQGSLRHWLGRMVRDIRRAGYDPLDTGGFRILAHAPNEFRFTRAADNDADGTVDGIRSSGYRLDGDRLQLWLEADSWRPVLEGVTDLRFTYRDAQGRETTVCESVALVEIALSARASTGGYPGNPPPVITEKTSAEIRNGVDC